MTAEFSGEVTVPSDEYGGMQIPKGEPGEVVFGTKDVIYDSRTPTDGFVRHQDFTDGDGKLQKFPERVFIPF